MGLKAEATIMLSGSPASDRSWIAKVASRSARTAKTHPARRRDGVSCARMAPARLRCEWRRSLGPRLGLLLAKKGVEVGHAAAFGTVLGKALEPAGGPQAHAFGFERLQI